MMLRSREPYLLTLLLVPLLLLTTRAPLADNGTSVTMNGAGGVRTCEDLDIRFWNDRGTLPMVRDEITLSEPGSIGALRAHLDRGQGVSVLAEDRSDYSILVCIATAGRDEARARALRDRLLVSHENGRITVDGPEDDSLWVVHLVVRAPRAGAVDLRTENGPISVHDLEGSVVVEATNGPVQVFSCSGTVSATTANGPIQVAGSRGEHRIRTQNGPIQVELEGTRWQDGRLEARSDNGPLTLQLPPDYRSGVMVTMGVHAPFSCTRGLCEDTGQTWDEGVKRRTFGDAKPLVRLTTNNGPVQIQSAGDDKDDEGA